MPHSPQVADQTVQGNTGVWGGQRSPADLGPDFLNRGKYTSFDNIRFIRRAGYFPGRHTLRNDPPKYEMMGNNDWYFHYAPSHDPVRQTSNAWIIVPP